MRHSLTTHFTYATPYGPATIWSNGTAITGLSFEHAPDAGTPKATDLTNRAATQLQEYLAGKRRDFDVPLAPDGSAFQKEVWAQLCELPYGSTSSAADVAAALGRAGAHRSVGTAIRRNPIPIFIPSHRVDLPNATGKTARIFRALRTLEARNV